MHGEALQHRVQRLDAAHAVLAQEAHARVVVLHMHVDTAAGQLAHAVLHTVGRRQADTLQAQFQGRLAALETHQIGLQAGPAAQLQRAVGEGHRVGFEQRGADQQQVAALLGDQVGAAQFAVVQAAFGVLQGAGGRRGAGLDADAELTVGFHQDALADLEQWQALVGKGAEYQARFGMAGGGEQ
ncbi:hypothetical protein D3C78_388200 [compost metagenome]